MSYIKAACISIAQKVADGEAPPRKKFGKGRSRRPYHDGAARPALMSRAAHAVESKAVVRIEVAASPRPCPLPGLRCVELALRAAPLRRGALYPGIA
jgi:hypothetical protein